MVDKKKIVIIDDDEDLLILLTHAFEKEGFEVITFVKGADASLYLSNPKNLQNVSLILLDRLLPDSDGLEILQHFREKSEIPVLILSVLSSEKDVLNGLKTGAVDYVSKPFSLPVLIKKAKMLIKK